MNYNDMNKVKNPRSALGSDLGKHVAVQDGFQAKAQAAHVGSANSSKFGGVSDISNKGAANKTK